MPDSKSWSGTPHEEWILSREEWIDARIEQWLGLLRRAIYPEWVPLLIECAPCADPLQLESWKRASYRAISQGERWGKAWDYAWFRFAATVPQAWDGSRVAARIQLGGECGVIGANGEFSQRLTHGSVFDHWCEVDEVPLYLEASGGTEAVILVQAWASNLDGVGRPMDPDFARGNYHGTHEGIVHRAELCRVDVAVKGLLHEAEILLGVARTSPVHSVRRRRVYRALLEAAQAWRDDPACTAQASEILSPELSRPASASALGATVTGHAHIDSAWMWRLRDSIGKCGRTFAHQLAYLEKYPGYVFGASSALHYSMAEEHFPETFAKIKQRVAQGRWEVQGTMWVEADTNLPSGESLIRQLLYGTGYIREKLGVDCAISWLPDVFGLSGALPQILQSAGVEYLLTKKPHWGRTNVFDKTTLRWQGNDGSEVLVHLVPQVRDYNGRLRSDDLARASMGFMESDRLEQFLYTFGVGDGGGGPSEPMLERAQRMASVEGLPRVRFGTAREVFDYFDEHRELLDLHQGDIYVEGHRGTYTTHALLKKKNRKLEILLGQIEHLHLLHPGTQYPHAELKDCWLKLLTNQFHDVLPGSGIREVFQDALADYHKIEEVLAALIARFSEALPEQRDGAVLFNSLITPWRGCLEASRAVAGAISQREPDGRVTSRIELPTLRTTNISWEEATQETRPLDELVLENDLLRCVFDEHGQITSLVEKATGRESIAADAYGNQFALYIDRPVDWDAWDIDDFYVQELVETARSEAPATGFTGPARSVLDFSLKIGNSHIRQRCILEAGASHVVFQTQVDWRERHKMLRVGFQTTRSRAISRNAVQHGFIDRPTHRNTFHEQARFEIPCHRYAALLDAEGGFALLNDCKYGVRAEGQLLELALLRSTTFPDHSADQGTHEFTYAAMPFSGAWQDAEVATAADRLNVMPLLLDGRDGSQLRPPVMIHGGSLGVECLKRAEDGEGIVLRLSNPTDQTVEAEIEVAGKLRVCEADSLERPLESECAPQVRLEPMRFKTYRLRP